MRPKRRECLPEFEDLEGILKTSLCPPVSRSYTGIPWMDGWSVGIGLGGRGVRWAEGGAEEWSAVTFNVMPRL